LSFESKSYTTVLLLSERGIKKGELWIIKIVEDPSIELVTRKHKKNLKQQKVYQQYSLEKVV
jgi:hypothetical protein